MSEKRSMLDQSVGGSGGEITSASTGTARTQNTEHVMVFKMGMTCEGCANAARKVLGKLGDEVISVDTDLEKQTVTVTTTLENEKILEKLKNTGKTVEFLSKT